MNELSDDMTYDAVIFDMDGVLVERTASEVFRRGVEDAFAMKGVPDPHDRDVSMLQSFGEVTIDDLERIATKYNVDATELWETREEFVSEGQLTELREGRKSAYADLEALDSLSVTMGVVSNNQQSTVDGVVEHYELAGHFDAWYGIKPTVSDIERKKPNPVYLEKIIADLDMYNPIYVGDKETDVQAAENADIDSAIIQRSHNKAVADAAEPTHTLRSLRALTELVSEPA